MDFGSATVAPDGGTAPFIITWGSGETGLTATQLPAGLNFVTLTDANACIDVREITILTTSGPTVQVISQTTVDCGDEARATATVAANDGVPPYSYRWSTGRNGAIATNLRAGLNTVTVTDGNNCTAELDVIIEQAGAPTLSLVSQTTIGCESMSTASASVLASGGTPAYTYAWSNGETGPTASSLPIGASMVTVTDARGCTAELTVMIEQAASPILTLEDQSLAGCGAQSAASATISAANGTPPYSFVWSSGETGTDASNLVVGINTVTVTDDKGCSDELTVTIEQAPDPTLAVVSLLPANCIEGTGAITVEATAGSGNFTYRWSHDAQLNGLVAGNLFSGTYGVTVTDELGCSTELTGLTIDFNAAPVLSLLSTTPSIGNTNSGSITLEVSAGTAPLVYSWTNDVSTGLVGENLPPGDYAITVTDANGCSDVVMATVAGEGFLGLTISSFTDASCGEANGRITVSPENGTAPFDYNWSHDETLASPMATGLTAGTYSVTITDANGITAEVSQIIGGSLAVEINGEAITPASCNQDVGTVEVMVSGGTGSLTYSWNHDTQAEGPIITGLPAGIYALTITDEVGCEATASYTIDNTDGPVISSSEVVNALCTDGTGIISLTVTDGLEPYAYSWSHDTGLNANSATDLSAGNYVVTVTDANNCTVAGNFSVAFQPAPTLSLSPTAPACGAPNTGSILAVLAGGQEPFTYSWSTTSTATFLENIPAGAYSLTVTDANGCMVSASTTVEATPNPVIGLEAFQDIACPEVLGSASFLVTNLDGPATITFSDPGAVMTQMDLGVDGIRVSMTGLTAGTYRLTVESDAGCTANEVVEITELPPFQLVVVNQEPSDCAGEASGSAQVGIIGSTEEFTFQWDAATGNQTGGLASGLSTGDYGVTATSPRGCTETLMVSIGAPDALGITETGRINPDCFGAVTGSITVEGSGGTNPYTFAWRGDTLPAFGALTNLPAGAYQVTVSDANGCQESLTITLIQPSEIIPATTVENNVCAGSAMGAITVDPTGGTPPYTYNWPDFPGETGNVVTGIPAGTYSVIVSDAVSCMVATSATVEEGSSSLTITVTDKVEVSCTEVADGSITVVATGDNEPFTYAWSNGITDAAIMGLAGGQSYVVTVTNTLGCTTELTVSLEAGASLEITGIPSDTSVCAGNIYALDLVDYPGATVSGPAGFASSDEVVLLEEAGDYEIDYTTTSGCSATHTLTLDVTVAALTARMVMASDIAIDQRLVVLEASFPLPDNVSWVIDESRVTLAEQDENVYYFEFSEPAVYEIGLIADFGGCSDAVSKQVTVHPDSTTIPGVNLGATEILELTIAPNPNLGAFIVMAELSSAQPFTLTLYRDNGERLERRQIENATTISEAFNLMLVPGTYFLQAQAGAERRMVAVIVQ
jgi:hypothetical protein